MRKSKRPILEKLPFIDVRDLKKAGALDGPWCEFRRVSLRYPFLDRLEAARYRVSMTMKNCAVAHAFRVEWARCNFGGARPWFRCKWCDKRVGKLYCGGMFIGCRHCYCAVYECQRRGDKGRKHQQASKIRLSLGGPPTIAKPFPQRPRRMWRKTYARLKARAELYESELRGTRLEKKEADYSRFSFLGI
jgi:hypothetical protein